MASGERTQSDAESDEEFEEMISDELRLFYFEDYEDQLVTQLKRKRLDRIDKILEILVADQNNSPALRFDIGSILVWEAFERMPIGECSELLRIIFRHCGQDFQRHVHYSVIRQAVFYNDHDSVDTLRETFGGRFVDQVVLEEQQKFRSRSPLLSASLRGDVAEVKGLLAAGSSTWLDEERTGFHWFFSGQDMHPVRAAEFGHTAVVDALLANSSRHDSHFSLCCCVWSIACRRSNLAMAASVVSAMGIQFYEHYWAVSECLEGTPDFLRDVLSLIKVNHWETWETFDKDLLWEVLEDAIEHRQRHHVRILLEEFNKDGRLFNNYLWYMRAVLRSRSAAILRDVLTRCPKALTNIGDCNPLRAIQDYHWPVGARLLVEAGAKIEGTVPSKFAGLLSLSLEDKCRIVVRRNMKLPLSQSVERLPLPGKVKRRLLYRWASPQPGKPAV